MTSREGDKFIMGAAMAGFAGGTFCTGLALSALKLNPISISTPVSDVVTLAASLIGAVVGGALSIAGTYAFQRAENRRRQREMAYTLLAQVAAMRAEIANLAEYIRDCERRNSDLLRTSDDYWKAIVPRAGDIPLRTLNEGAMGVLIAHQEFKLYSEVILLETHHNSLAEGWNEYCRTRRQLGALMPVEDQAGSALYSDLDRTKHPEAFIRILEANSLIISMLKLMPDRLDRSARTASKIGPAFVRIFNDRTFPTVGLSPISGVPQGKPRAAE
ncbi:Hypothetical protein NGAL_HAMBI2605_10400 [Neorhizobium galegae bv. orientalis]|nr:Hypothetical protein NGAL_HAMBI2605_10400 [Neorhizobium galegae bv. orientalis]